MFNPTFYWTGDNLRDAELINRPHIIQEGPNEDRIVTTIKLLSDLTDVRSFGIIDVMNIQNAFLKVNNWKGIRPGLRTHNVNFEDTPDWSHVPSLIEHMFPVFPSDSDQLLEWYKKIQTIHPLSDLKGRVFGIIVSILYKQYLQES